MEMEVLLAAAIVVALIIIYKIFQVNYKIKQMDVEMKNKELRNNIEESHPKEELIDKLERWATLGTRFVSELRSLQEAKKATKISEEILKKVSKSEDNVPGDCLTRLSSDEKRRLIEKYNVRGPQNNNNTYFNFNIILNPFSAIPSLGFGAPTPIGTFNRLPRSPKVTELPINSSGIKALKFQK